MILHFPRVEVLQLALTAGIVPPEVHGSACAFAAPADGGLWLRPETIPAVAVQRELARIGVNLVPDGGPPLGGTADCWAQALPLVPEAPCAPIGEKTAVLFEIPGAGPFADLVREMLRLGNDRQTFRWLDDGAAGRALLRVMNPPYYTLLRATDRGGEAGPVAYREAAARVWVEVGFRHPLADHLRPPTAKLLLIRAPHTWTYLPEGRLRDIYEVIDFDLPDRPAAWQPADLPARLQVPVRLARAPTHEPDELWILADDEIHQLDGLVRHADDQLVARLAFAVGQRDGRRIVALRARPSKQPPPVLPIRAPGFRPYRRIPNLYLPTGTRLHPPLRRDAVVGLLAGDANRLTWLWPHPDHQFTPESLPDDAFRPLSEWVDYVLDHAHVPLEAWVQSMRFEFEPFVCPDDEPPRTPDKDKPDPRERRARRRREPDVTPSPPAIDVVDGSTKPADEDVAAPVPTEEPDQLQRRLGELEGQFLSLVGPPDDARRRPLWREMASLNARLGRHGDAAACWGNALWLPDDAPAGWPLHWLRSGARGGGDAPPVAADVLRPLAKGTPTQDALHRLVLYLAWAARTVPPPADLPPLLGRAQQVLEKHETLLGVRPLWLAWHALYRLTGDVLALARARDRLLERLHVAGLSADLDLATFLRFGARRDQERFRAVHGQLVQLRDAVQQWAMRGNVTVAITAAYIDLVFAYGLARLGETAASERLLTLARGELAHRDEVHAWLCRAYEYRVRQALQGSAAAGRLPEDLHKELAELRDPEYLRHLDLATLGPVKDRLRMTCLKIDRLRQFSRILEPHEKVEPFSRWHNYYNDALGRTLGLLGDTIDRGRLMAELHDLLGGKRKFPGVRDPEPAIVSAALQLAPRLGEEFAEDVLRRVRPLLDRIGHSLQGGTLLARALFVAAHFDRGDDVPFLVERFQQLLREPKKGLPLDNLEELARESFRGLRKLGLRHAVAGLLSVIRDRVEQERRALGPSPPSAARARLQCNLLQVAAGWLYFGEEAAGRRVLDETRTLLLRAELAQLDQTAVACAYLDAVSQATVELAVARVKDLFGTLRGVSDCFVTHTHYSLTRLRVVEAGVLALVTEDLTADREARRWLDEDEFLIRRRVHADVRQAQARAGI